VDAEKIMAGVRQILEGIGEDLDREGLQRTPERVAEACAEIFGGIGRPLADEIRTYHVDNHDEMIVARNIPFYSVCEHHLLPFFGRAHIAYIPDGNRITGLSNLVKMLEAAARQPTIQERLTTEVCDTLLDALEPLGVLVLVEAEHLCMTMRGVKKPGARIVTSAMRGQMREEASRLEALQHIHGARG